MKSPRAILIVDDNPDNAFLAKRAISQSRAGCSIEVATDGLQAIERLRKAKPPALIFLDLKMPGTGGIEVLQFIRSCEQTQYIPVVMLSSSNMEEDLKASYAAGANGFLHKTHDFTKFTESIKTALHYWIDVNMLPGCDGTGRMRLDRGEA